MPRWLVSLRWVLLAIPPAITAIALAPTISSAGPSTAPSATVAPASDPVSKPVRMPGPPPNAKPETTATSTATTPTVVTPPPAGQEVFFGPSDTPRVALTFDDGPSAELTPWILSTLRRHDVQATFFVLGQRAEKLPDVLQEIDEAGHEIGNHGWTHTSLRSLFPEQIEQEVDDTNAVVEAATGKQPALFRPPFGRYPPSSVPLVAERGMSFVLWNADSRDWARDADTDAIVERVLDEARPGAIILLHDSQVATARALDRILTGLSHKGLEIVPVSELTGLPPVSNPPAPVSQSTPNAPGA